MSLENNRLLRLRLHQNHFDLLVEEQIGSAGNADAAEHKAAADAPDLMESNGARMPTDPLFTDPLFFIPGTWKRPLKTTGEGETRQKTDRQFSGF